MDQTSENLYKPAYRRSELLLRGAGGRTRTDDLTITNRLRFQLRHTGVRWHYRSGCSGAKSVDQLAVAGGADLQSERQGILSRSQR
jgi:hypothetical protein